MLELSLYFVYGVLTAITAYMAIKLMRALTGKQVQLHADNRKLKHLPSVSVCIPARNEIHALTPCLEAVLASDYPKLEVIVLDDKSQDETPVLIKSFAHEGVRFIEGEPLKNGWLGKNHALQELLDEASGDFVLFLDVDARIEPHTITALMSHMHHNHLEMVSALPMRFDGWRSSVLLSPLRYFWTLTMSSGRKPPIASSTWLIDRNRLQKDFDGFSSLRSDPQPELQIAQRMGSGYQFLVSYQLGVGFEKKWSSQVDTSIRLLFSMFGGNLFGATAMFVAIFLLNVPTIVIFASFFTEESALYQLVAIWQLSLFIALYGLYTSRAWSRGWWLGALLWPIIIIQEMVLLLISIYRNLTNSLTWKGRPVTIKR